MSKQVSVSAETGTAAGYSVTAKNRVSVGYELHPSTP